MFFPGGRGKVNFFNDTGGYGVISTEDTDDDVFLHMEGVGGDDLTEGTEIGFDIEQAPKGARDERCLQLTPTEHRYAAFSTGSFSRYLQRAVAQ